MALSIGSFLLACVFSLNAVTILNEERFLVKGFLFNFLVGLGRNTQFAPTQAFDYQAHLASAYQPSSGNQLVNLIFSVQTVMRVPLILINLIAIFFLLIFG